MNAENRIGIDAVRLWCCDKITILENQLRDYDLKEYETKGKVNQSFLKGMIYALKMVDESTFNENSSEHYIDKSRDLDK